MSTGPILPPPGDDLPPESALKSLYQMVRDLWMEQFGGRGVIGQSERVRNLEHQVAEQAAQLDEHEGRIRLLEAAPGKEAEGRVHEGRIWSRDLWLALFGAGGLAGFEALKDFLLRGNHG